MAVAEKVVGHKAPVTEIDTLLRPGGDGQHDHGARGGDQAKHGKTPLFIAPPGTRALAGAAARPPVNEFVPAP